MGNVIAEYFWKPDKELVSQEENDSLQAPFTAEEIKVSSSVTD